MAQYPGLMLGSNPRGPLVWLSHTFITWFISDQLQLDFTGAFGPYFEKVRITASTRWWLVLSYKPYLLNLC